MPTVIPKCVAHAHGLSGPIHAIFEKFSFDRVAPIALREHDRAMAVVPRLHAVDFVRSSGECHNFGVVGRGNVHLYQAVRTVTVIVYGPLFHCLVAGFIVVTQSVIESQILIHPHADFDVYKMVEVQKMSLNSRSYFIGRRGL